MDQRIAVLMAVDERFAAPLLVTVASFLEHLRPGVGVDLYVMAGQLQPGTRRELEGIQNDRVRLRWVPFDHRKLNALRGHGYPSSAAANFRLIAGTSLPANVKKVIYLDADILVRKDIFLLWGQDMQGNIALAVQDCYIQELPMHLSPTQWKEVKQPYFNSGVMVIDLVAWKAARIERRCLAAARRFPRGTKWLDQHVLNVCLAGRWGALAPVWNKQFFLDVLPDWQCSPYTEAEFHDARRDPAIIHFCSRTKPWHAFCDHPEEDVVAYREAIRRNGLRARLEVTPSRVARAIEFLAAPHRRVLDAAAVAMRAKRRKHALRMILPDLLKRATLHPWTFLTVPLSLIHERTSAWLSGLTGAYTTDVP